MTNTINTNTINTNTIITADDLRKLVKAFALHTYDVVQSTEPDDDTTIAVLTERTKKLHAESVAMQEIFDHYYIFQGSHLDEDTARSIIRDLLMDKIGMALALSNLVKQIGQEPESELSPEEIAEINAQEETPIDISKLEAI